MFVQQDSEREMIDLLGKAVDNPDAVSAALPPKWTPAKGIHITVEPDGTPISSKGWTRETLRIGVHGAQKSQVSKILRQVDGFLLSPRYGHFLSIKPGMGILTTPDSRLGGYIASATYRVAKPRIFLGGEQ